MALTPARKIQTVSRNCWKLPFPVALLFVIGLTDCNTCVTFTSNPPNGTLGIMAGDPRPACTVPKMNAAVHLKLAVEPVCGSCVGSGQVQHIFINIRGIELNSSAIAQDSSPDWQELLPAELEQKPLQVDLMQGNADGAVQTPFGKTALVPAGIYRQLRLRLVPNQPAMEDRLPERNPCGSETFNCIVMADGTIQPLQLDDVFPELRITSDKMEGASLRFLPDTNTDMVIQLKLGWELSSSANTGIRLLPALTTSAKVRRINLDEGGTPEDGVVNDSQSR